MKKTKKIITILASLILVLFIWHNFLVTGNNIIFVFIFIMCLFFIKKTTEIENKRANIIAIVISLVFTIIEIVCKSISKDYTLNNIMDKWLIINVAGYFTMGWLLIKWLYNYLDKVRLVYDEGRLSSILILKNKFILFGIFFILIVVAWIPYFLKYYPGIITPDSCSQIEQAIGILGLQDHHPIAHTAIITVCVKIGQLLFNNINISIAIYSITSMICMAAMDSIILIYLKKIKVHPTMLLLTLVYYMFYPVNGMYAITMWKDVLFSGLLPIFIILCNGLIFNTEKFLKNKYKIICFIIISFFTMILRHNGLYVVIFTLPFIFIVLRNYWKKLIPIFISILFIYQIFNIIVFNILNVEKGSVAEMLSIPVQQIARVEKYHREEIDNVTMENINKIFKINNIGDEYNPTLSDPVKAKVDVTYFKENKLEFFKLWVKLLIKYPKDYIESFISNSYGYYYPEAHNWVVSRATMGNELGIQQQPKIKGELVEKYDSFIDNRDIPLVSMLFSIGAGVWTIMVCLGYKIYKKQYRYILLYLPIFILWLTCIASPVFCEFRYAYPIFTGLPLYISINFKYNNINLIRKDVKNG